MFQDTPYFKIIPLNFNFSSIDPSYANSTWTITHQHDLSNSPFILPQNVTLKFEGGSFINCSIITGNKTKIDAPLNQIFFGRVAYARS